MTSKNVNGTTTNFTYNAANQLTQASGGMNMSYSYDANGDLTSRSDGTQLSLNASGQITSITPPASQPINMTYTGRGEQQRVGAGSMQYQYDATGLSKQADSSGPPTSPPCRMAASSVKQQLEAHTTILPTAMDLSPL